jgi:hypothetical protein
VKAAPPSSSLPRPGAALGRRGSATGSWRKQRRRPEAGPASSVAASLSDTGWSPARPDRIASPRSRA